MDSKKVRGEKVDNLCIVWKKNERVE